MLKITDKKNNSEDSPNSQFIYGFAIVRYYSKNQLIFSNEIPFLYI